MSKYDKMHELAGVLNCYVEQLPTDEYQEGSYFVAELLRRDTGTSSQFDDALIKEAEERIAWYQENTETVEETRTETIQRMRITD